jgi:hypothetical protein
MPCHAMHPMQDLSLESFSYELQFDMHFYMHSYLHKIFILVKSGWYTYHRQVMSAPIPKAAVLAMLIRRVKAPEWDGWMPGSLPN